MFEGNLWDILEGLKEEVLWDLFSPHRSAVMAATSNNIITFRRHDLDNLRTFLTGLVSVHHAALSYGGVGGWPFRSAAFAGRDSPLLMGLNAVDQSFFMGLFFWVSGRVSGQSLSKSSSPWAFVKSKMFRLGVPTVGYALVVDPVIRVMLLPSWTMDSVQSCLIRCWSNTTSVKGPLWYTATLLTFDIIAALCWTVSRKREASKKIQSSTYEKLSKYGWLVVGACCALARAQSPPGAVVPVISLQLGYAAQYVYAYVLGHLAYQCDESRMVGPFDSRPALVGEPPEADVKSSVSSYSSSVSVWAALAISLLSLNVIFLPRFLDTPDWFSATMRQASGWNLPAMLYAFWNEFSFVVVGPALMAYFERSQNKPAESSTWNARYSYAAFLLHTPIIVAMELVVEKLLFSNVGSHPWMSSKLWQVLGPVVMTVGVGLSGTWASFFVGKKLLEWVPGLKRII